MFEAQVAYYLNNYLGKYVYGLDPQSLKISVFKGDVVLRNLKLKPEALADLDLPVTAKSGLLGSLTLKVPWASLGKSPVLVELDRLYVLAGPKADNLDEDEAEMGGGDLEAAERALKRRRVHDAEMAWTSDKFKVDKGQPASGGGRFRAIIDTVIGNLQLSITNVHIRYEDDVSSSGQPFALGFTLEKLTAHTVDKEGKQTFVTHNPLDLLRKGSKLQRLALYFDVGGDLWQPKEDWAKLPVDTWDNFFQPGISLISSEKKEAPSTYVLQPIDGQLMYLRRGPNVGKDPSQAVQEADIQLDSISLQVTKGQYQSMQSLLGQFSAFSARQPNSHLRPKGRPKKGRNAVRWWHYAVAANRKQIDGQHVTWQQMSSVHTTYMKVVALRKKYVPAYVRCLQSNKMGGDEEIEAMDAKIPEHTILVFRRLAHAKVEKEKRRAAVQAAAEYQKSSQNQGWLGWLWGAAGTPPQKAGEDADMRADLNEEEYKKLEELVSEQEAAVKQGVEKPDSLQMEVRVKIGSGSIALEGEEKVKVLKGGMEGLWLTAQKFPVTLGVALSLDGVGLLSPEGTILRAGAQLQHSASLPALDTGVPEVETKEGKATKQAMDVEFIQKPQDGRADTVLNVALAPSFVSYNPKTIERIMGFFHNAEALDLSTLSVQAIAQVEKARQAAQQQLAAAFQEKPKIALRFHLEAPKIAVPLPETSDGQGSLTLVADLGTFIVETDTRTAGQLSPQEAALYECLRLEGRNISAYLVDGKFSFASLEKRLTSTVDGSSLDLAQAESADSVYIPLLERTGVTAAVQAARFNHPKLPKLRSQLTLPSLRFFFSPARVGRIMRIVRSALPESSQKEDPREALAKAVWRTQAEHEGSLRALEWGGIGYTSATWPHRYAVLYRGQLSLLDKKMSLTPLASQTLYMDRKIVHVAPETIGGTQNVIAIYPADADPSKLAENSRSILLRLGSKIEAEEWLTQLTKSAERMKELAGQTDAHPLGIDLDAETASLTSSMSREDLHKVSSDLSQAAAGAGEAEGQPQAPMELQASLGELALYVSGRPCQVWWPPEEASKPEGETAAAPKLDSRSGGAVVNIDNEESLLVVRASAGSADASVGGPHLSASVAVGRFEIEDLLVGARCPAHRYLARSFEAGQDADETDDNFVDAREELSTRSPSTGSMQSEAFQDTEGPSQLAETAEPKMDAAWVMEFETWQQGTTDYANVDAELRMRLTTLYFFCNRPTIGALMAIGGDLSNALSSPAPSGAALARTTSTKQTADGAAEQETADADIEASISEESSVGPGQLILEGGSERTVFRMFLEVDKLEATLLYEDEAADPLALAHIEDVRFNLHVHPSTLRLTASLGNLRAQDGLLPEGHPFRNVCDLRRDATTSLIELEYTTHTAEESLSNRRVPTGLPYSSVSAQMHRLDVVFLSRFMFEILRYINLLLALQPAPLNPKEGSVTSEPSKQASAGGKKAKGKSQVGMILELDVSVEAPVITMPRHSDSQDAIEVDLGSLHLSNTVAWRNGSSADDPQAVLVEEDVLTLEGLGTTVRVDGRRGKNIIREYDSGTHIKLQRALRDLRQQLPKVAVAIEVPSIKAALSDREYQLITSIAGENFNEQQRLPAAALWLEHHYQEPGEDPGNDTIAEGDEEGMDDTAVPQVAMDRAVASVRPDKAPAPSADEKETALRVTVNVHKSELELLYTANEATGKLACLARFTVGKLWVAFRSMAGSRMALSLSLPLLEVVDLRPGLPDEHRLIIAAAAGSRNAPQEHDEGNDEPEDNVDKYKARASFLTMEFESDSVLAHQKLQLRLQRPTITAEMSFMLSVTKFVVPTFALSGAKPIPFETLDLRLTEAEYKADADLWLSPEMRLLADSPAQDDYIYDGQGHRIVLPEGISAAEPLPLLVIGAGKALLLRNVTLVCAASLAACLQLGPGAQLIAEQHENVTKLDGPDPSLANQPDPLESGFPLAGRGSHALSGTKGGTGRSTSMPAKSIGRSTRGKSTGRSTSLATQAVGRAPASMQLEFVALGVGLRFVELGDAKEQGSSAASSRTATTGASSPKQQYFARMLAAYLDVGGCLSMEGDTMALKAEMKGLRLETVIDLDDSQDALRQAAGHSQVKGTVLEPTRIGVGMQMTGPSGQFSLDVSNIRINLSPDILELATSIQTSVVEPLIQPPAEQPLSKCSRFVKVWGSPGQRASGDGTSKLLDTSTFGASSDLTFWRPQPPVGYAVLGDCVTAGNAQPTFQVLAVAVNSGLVTYPTGFTKAGYTRGLTLWEPKPPAHYVALGHMAVSGEEEPQTTEVVCVHESVGVQCALGECLQLRDGDGQTARSPGDVNIWNVDNAAATFLVCSAADGSPPGPFLDLRSPLGMTPAMLRKEPQPHISQQASKAPTTPQKPALTQRSYQQFSRTRKELIQSTSKLRLQSRAVDFRRVWWDKALRGASREGMSLWRPNPPAGYVALGDCLVSGYDPPTYAVMLQRQSQQSNRGTSSPLLKPPQDYKLTWRDESARADRALHLWRPIPWPGYIAVGCVASVGGQKPSRSLIRCIRADAVSAKSSPGRPVAALSPVGRRLGFKAWAGDDRLGTFMLTKGEEPPLRDDLWHIRVLDTPEDSSAGSTNAERKEGMDVVVRTGHMSLLLRDALRRPLMELELGAVQASLRRPVASVMQFYCGIHISAWSFNPTISAWEPMLESWDLIIKMDANRGSQISQGVDPGMHVTVKSTSEIVHVTLAYAAATTALTSLLEWQDLASRAGGDAYKRQLAAADASSVHTIVDNRLGVQAMMQLDFGDRLVSAELPEGKAVPVLQPLSPSPSRYTESDDVGPSPEAVLPPMLFVDLRYATGVKQLLSATCSPLAPQELFLAVVPSRSQSAAVPSWGLHSRAVLPDLDKEKVKWHERLVLELPKSKEAITLEVQLWDAAAAAGQGVQLAAGTIQVDWQTWQEGSVNRRVVKLQGTAATKDLSADLSTRLTVVYQTGPDEGHVPTDRWTAEASTAGQRAIHLGRLHKGWAIVPPTGLQRSVAVANKHLKQNIAGKTDPRNSGSASLSVVRIGSGDGIALEGGFREGVKRETLRSLCQVTNGTRLSLEVALVDAGDEWEQVPENLVSSRSQPVSSAARSRSQSQTTQASPNQTVEEEVFENERYLPIRGWSSRNLLPTDRRRFTRGRSQSSSESTTEFPKVYLPDGWDWEGPWELETSGYVDKDGWTYGVDFGTLEYPPSPGNQRKAMQHFVRRRRYVRKRKPVSLSLPSIRTTSEQQLADMAEPDSPNAERMVLGVVDPGDSLPLPFGWRKSGKQVQVRPVLEGGGKRTHAWSVGATEGSHTILLGSLEEGSTRLAACMPLPDSVRRGRIAADDESLAAKLSVSPIWLSLTVEGDALPSDGGEPLTDWRVVIAPPLIIQNQLPVTGSYLIWEEPRDGENMVLRQNGESISGSMEHIYAADTRHGVRLQFVPHGYRWVEPDPVLISQGFISSRAGVTGKQQLPEKFKITHLPDQEGTQDVFINREISMDTWLLEGKEGELDPGAAIAKGSPVLVRVYVPLWIVNATNLLIAALAVPTDPPPKASSSAEGEQSQGDLLNAAESIKLRIMETRNASTSGRLPARQVAAGSVAMLAFPQTQLQAFKDGERQNYGLRVKVGDSGWTDPLPLDSSAAASTGEASSKPVLIRARIPEWGCIHEIVARLDLVGSGYERTLVMRLEPHCIISNRTGVPLQLMQWRSDIAAECFDDRAGGGTMVSSSRGGLPRATIQTPAQPGIKSASRDPEVDWTSCMDLPPGSPGAPLHWSTKSDRRSFCLRLTPDGSTDPTTRWSHPVELSLGGSTRKFLAIPVRRIQQASSKASLGAHYLRKVTTMLNPAAPAWQMHGPRVTRQIQHFERPSSETGESMEEVDIVVLRYSTELRAPGCLQLVLESVSSDPPYLLENRSSQSLQYRQANLPGLPFADLPPFSAAGFTWQVPGQPERGTDPATLSSGDWQQPQAHLEVEVVDAVGDGDSGAKYCLDPRGPHSMNDDNSQAMHHTSSMAEQQRLPIAAGKELQVAVRNLDQEIMARAGLQSLGSTSGVGRGGVIRALRISPVLDGSPPSLSASAAEDSIGNALYVAITIAAIEVSLVDHTPEEIMLVTATGLTLDYAAGIGPDCNFISTRASVNNIQIDDQLASSRFPVVLTPASVDATEGGVGQPLIQACIVCQPGNGAHGQVYFPYMSFRVSKPLQVAVTETLVWRVVETIERLNLGAVSSQGEDQSVAATSDSPVSISLINMTDLAAFVSFRGDTLSRPRWAAAMGALSWGLDMANFEAVPVRLQGFEMEKVAMLWSVFVRHVMRLIQGQLTTVALSFLRNFGIFSGTSGVLSALSAGVGSLAGDRDADKERQKDRRDREIGGLGEGVAEGGQSIASGFKRGFTGLINKPLQGAKQAGVGGFISGVGRGLVGAVANPVSGGLDALSSTFEGIDAASSSLLGRARPQAARRSRLPRAIGGDHKLLPFKRPPDNTEKQARIEEVGQSMLRGARDRDTSTLSLIKRKKRRSDRTQDAYEDHFVLQDDLVVILTNRAMILLLAPGFAEVQRSAQDGLLDSSGAPDIPAAELRWAVLWKDLLSLELSRSHRELRYPDRLQVHRKGRLGQQEEEPLAHELRCYPNTRQAEMIKALALKIRNKYYVSPRTEAEAWDHRRVGLRHQEAKAQGLPPQQLPPTMPSLEYRRVWHTTKLDTHTTISVWHPVGPPGYRPLGDIIYMGLDPPPAPVQVIRHMTAARDGVRTAGSQELPLTAPPAEFHLVWRSQGQHPVTLWEPVPMPGYRALGTIAMPALEVPSTQDVLCVREDRCQPTAVFDSAAWQWEPPAGGLSLQRMKPYYPETWKCSLWQVDNKYNTFLAVRSLHKPPGPAVDFKFDL